MFSQKELAKVLNDTLPDDRTNAVVGVVDTDGLAVVIRMHKDEHWEIDGVFKRDWTGEIGAQAKVIYSW